MDPDPTIESERGRHRLGANGERRVTPKTWGAGAAIVAALLGGGGTSTYVIGQVNELKKDAAADRAETKRTMDADRAAGWKTQQDVEVIKERLKNLDDQGKEIKSDVKELLRRIK